MVGFSVFRRMTDGIFASREDAFYELLVFVIVGQLELHLLDYSNNHVPSVTPRFYRTTFRSVSTADEGIEQHILLYQTFLDSPDAHTDITPIN